MSGYGLALAFDTDDPEFARGFEAGRLWERIKEDAADWDELVHASNAEMLMRMCEAEGRAFTAEEIDATYVQVFVR